MGCGALDKVMLGFVLDHEVLHRLSVYFSVSSQGLAPDPEAPGTLNGVSWQWLAFHEHLHIVTVLTWEHHPKQVAGGMMDGAKHMIHEVKVRKPEMMSHPILKQSFEVNIEWDVCVSVKENTHVTLKIIFPIFESWT